MKYILKHNHRNLTDKILLDDLRRTAKILGKEHVSALEYSNMGKYYASTITRRFGSWNDALTKAGLNIKKLRQIQDQDLMLNLKKVWNTLGRQPLCVEMVKPLSKYRPKVYARHFGSWNAALEQFVQYAEKGKRLPPLGGGWRGVDHKAKHIKRFKEIITKSMRYDILRRDNFKCRLCGANPAVDPLVKLHIDHIIPLAKGGKTIKSNLQTLCRDCNMGKAAKKV